MFSDDYLNAAIAEAVKAPVAKPFALRDLFKGVDWEQLSVGERLALGKDFKRGPSGARSKRVICRQSREQQRAVHQARTGDHVKCVREAARIKRLCASAVASFDRYPQKLTPWISRVYYVYSSEKMVRPAKMNSSSVGLSIV